MGYHGYPASLCASVNEEVVHGIPSPRRVLREGDIIGLDFGVVLDGFYGDAAITVPVGDGRRRGRAGSSRSPGRRWRRRWPRPGPDRRVGDLGAAVQRLRRAARLLGGARLRRPRHRPAAPRAAAGPQLRHHRAPGPGCRAGMVLAIEPMVNAGRLRGRHPATTAGPRSRVDGSLSAHFEHTVARHGKWSGNPDLAAGCLLGGKRGAELSAAGRFRFRRGRLHLKKPCVKEPASAKPRAWSRLVREIPENFGRFAYRGARWLSAAGPAGRRGGAFRL